MRRLAAVPFLIACASATAQAEPADVQGYMTASRPGFADDVMQVLPGSSTPTMQLAGTTQILYLNHHGATLHTSNVNDSRTQASTLVAQTTAVPAYSGTDTQWASIVSCEQKMW